MTVVASNFERQKNELYETEAWATRALLRHFPVTGLSIWEPAAGNHKIADVLREAGARRVFTSDIETYEREHDALFDFLGFKTHNEPGINAIITNPPYGKGNRDAVMFAKNALDRCEGLVALLLTAKFDFGKTRKSLFQDNPRFWAKIALLDRIQWFEGATTGTEDHAWYVWGPKGADYGTPRLLYGERI
jgi:hypothetical protein